MKKIHPDYDFGITNDLTVAKHEDID